jgi:uncharacterized protein YrzB (UPF0473 family)
MAAATLESKREFMEMVDEHGNSAWFAVDLTIEAPNGKLYAVLTHVDEEGNDMSEESTLFIVENPGTEDVVFAPVEDDDEFDMVYAILGKAIEAEAQAGYSLSSH